MNVMKNKVRDNARSKTHSHNSVFVFTWISNWIFKVERPLRSSNLTLTRVVYWKFSRAAN